MLLAKHSYEYHLDFYVQSNQLSFHPHSETSLALVVANNFYVLLFSFISFIHAFINLQPLFLVSYDKEAFKLIITPFHHPLLM